MPDERLITEIENMLAEIIALGGANEITTIVPNVVIVDANPSGLTGFCIITDPRDGDNVPAKKVPGVLYANNDLVNVLFIEGTEPIAYQQASQSSGSAVAVSKLVSPDETIDPVFSADNDGHSTAVNDVSADNFAFVVKNTSGAVAAANEVGFINEDGEYKTTTSQFGNVEWCVVIIGGANNADIYVARRGRVTIELDGNCSVGDKLYTSTTAGQANPQSYMRPEMLAVALTANASGAGGTCEALLHTATRYIPRTSTSNIYRFDNHSDTNFVATINGAPTATTVVYNAPSAGSEDAIKPTGAKLAQARLWNTTRSTYRLIDTVDTGTNTITTESSTDSWADTDTITIVSQTTTTGTSYKYIELDFQSQNIVSEFARAVMFGGEKEDSSAVEQLTTVQTFDALSASKSQTNNNHGTGSAGRGYRLINVPLIQRVFCFASQASGSGTGKDIFRLVGYFVASP